MLKPATPPNFVILCKPELHNRLYSTFPTWAEQWILVDKLQKALECILRNPPLALLLEISTAIKLPKRQFQALLDLGVCWPVIRCGFRPDGQIMAMCEDPPKVSLLEVALAEISRRDPEWINPRYRRLALRMFVEGKAKLRRTGEDWRPGVFQNIGCGGAFVATFDQWQVGENVTVELHDLGTHPFVIDARVANVRTWETQRGIPGIGLAFPEQFPQRDELASQISSPAFLTLPLRDNSAP